MDDGYDVYDDEDGEHSGIVGLFGKPRPGKNTDRDDDNDGGLRSGTGGHGNRNSRNTGKKKKDDIAFKWKLLLVVAAVAVAILISIPLSDVVASVFSDRSGTVPDVLGMDEETAIKTLKADGFNYDVEYVSDSEAEKATGDALAVGYEPGQVIKQDPAGDSKAKKNTTVKITVLTGTPANEVQEEEAEEEEVNADPAEKAVPNVVGKARADAEAAITASGFAVGDTTPRNSDSPVGTVIEQTPKSGEMLQMGKKVNIVLSSGPKAKTTTVPEVVGSSIDAAKGILAGSNLEMGMITYDYSSEFSTGTVMSQNPAAGTVLEEWKAVSVVVCLGAGPTVPPFAGLDLDSYLALLNSWGLTAIPQSEYSNTEPVGLIIRVDPAPGMAVSAGSSVNVYVSLGPPPVAGG
jgi:serine/threonine-protein kinase